MLKTHQVLLSILTTMSLSIALQVTNKEALGILEILTSMITAQHTDIWALKMEEPSIFNILI